MKVTLEFNLPEDAQEHDLAMRGRDWYGALYALEMVLRNMVKYEDDRALKASEFRKILRDELDDRELRFEL